MGMDILLCSRYAKWESKPVWNSMFISKEYWFDTIPITGDSAKELETQLRSHCSKYEKLDELLKSSICK